MKKSMAKLALYPFLFALALLLPAHQGCCAAKTPEQFVNDFYAWYFQAGKDEANALENDEIFKYVARDTVEYARSDTVAVDYFRQMGLLAVEWNDAKAVAQTAIPMADGMFVVPVTLKLESRDWHVIVSVKQDGDALYIVDVTNIFPYL